ncbi:hypothetical protein [Kitasatospora sp. NPDC097691]|uniref:hypothetical protein n=1 Tax=Kitasatospora sp. NPDC097691 TaxID=3157231 RepID=UPI00332E7F50
MTLSRSATWKIQSRFEAWTGCRLMGFAADAQALEGGSPNGEGWMLRHPGYTDLAYENRSRVADRWPPSRTTTCGGMPNP